MGTVLLLGIVFLSPGRRHRFYNMLMLWLMLLTAAKQAYQLQSFQKYAIEADFTLSAQKWYELAIAERSVHAYPCFAGLALKSLVIFRMMFASTSWQW